MKLAITLIVIGGLLILEGNIRIGLGMVHSDWMPILGGMLTGVALGGYLLYRGIKRLMATRKVDKK